MKLYFILFGLISASFAGWSVHQTSATNSLIVSATLGTKAYFTGGSNTNPGLIDIYDASSNSWSTKTRPTSGGTYSMIAAAGNVVAIAGGMGEEDFSSTVDILDTTTDTWSTISLGRGTALGTGFGIAGKLVFVGGFTAAYSQDDTVDIFDATTFTHTTATFPVVYVFL